jgi:hypothetical protein
MLEPDYRSPGQQWEGGSSAEILAARKATRVTSLKWVSTNLRAILAAHVALQFVDERRFRPTHDIERDGLVRPAPQTFDFKIKISRVQRVAQGRGGLRRPLSMR